MYFVKRNKIFHLFYSDSAGKLKSISTKCSTRKEANQFAIKHLSRKEEPQEKPKEYSYKEFTDFYEGYALSRFSNSYQSFVKIAFSQFGKVVASEKHISKITAMDIEQFIAMKKLKVKDRIINGYLITLQAAFERALEFGLIQKNVFKVVKKLKPTKNLPLFISKEEMDLLLEKEDEERFRLIYRVGAYTGMRMGEIRFLRWRAIDFNKDLITVQNHEEFTTKSKKSRDIPLHISLREELLALKGEPDEYVFLYNVRQYSKELLSRNFKEANRRAKLNKKYHFHTLRHTFASWLVQKGVSIYEVSKLLGHADIKTTEIYAHLKENNLRSSVNLL